MLDEYGKPDYNLKIGKGKYYLGGPKCKYNGKEFDCLNFCLESGGITGKILVAILTCFDSSELFPRVEGGSVPVLIVDGHQSRLHTYFVNYVNNKAHLWRILFGVPYATVLWQVGDASDHNGKFKVKWYKIKLRCMQWKDKLNLPIFLSATNIIPLTNQIFNLSYVNLVANMKATANRGRFPFNRMLLDHPKLVDDSKYVDANTHAAESDEGNDVAATSNSNTGNTITLNLGEEASDAVLDRLISKRTKSAGGKKAADERKRKEDLVTQNLREAKKLLYCVIVSNGIHLLNDEQFLEAYNQRSTDAIKKAKKIPPKRGRQRIRRWRDYKNCEKSMEMIRLTFLLNLTWRSARYTSNTKNNLLRTHGCQRLWRRVGLLASSGCVVLPPRPPPTPVTMRPVMMREVTWRM